MDALFYPEIWIYVDESGDPEVGVRGGDSRYFSIGMLSVQTPILREPIARALDGLRADAEAQTNHNDGKCLDRGYFHASLDSKNAHSHICMEVAKLRPAEFRFLSFDKADAQSSESFLSTSTGFHKHMVELVAAKTAGNRIRRINLCVAERQTFPDGVADFWRDEFLRKMTISAAELPQVPCCFPELRVQIVGGDDPGIQMADFLLWAALRRHGPAPSSRCKWCERVKLVFDTAWSEVDGPLRGVELHLNETIPAFNETAFPDTHIKAPDEPASRTALAESFAWAEAKIQCLVRHGLPDHVSHMAGEVTRVAELLRSPAISLETVQQMASLALRLIDTVPFYEPTNKEEVHFAIDAKKMLGIILLGREIRWFSIASWWREARVDLAREQPHFLGWT